MAWDIQAASDPFQALISRAIELGFKSPLLLEFKDSNGHGFTQALRVDDTGNIVGSEDPDFLEGTNGDEPIVAPCSYTLTDPEREQGVEVLIDPNLLN